VGSLQDTVYIVLVWGLSALGVYQLAYLARRYGQRIGLLPSRRRSGFAKDTDVANPAEQLTRVMASPFTTRPVMSMQEYKVFQMVEREAAACRMGYRVFAQTSLGEVLQSPDEFAFRSINSKRADVLVIDYRGHPVIAVEYQGSGHFQGTAAVRDAVKREALRKAGVEQVEIFVSHSPEDAATTVRSALRRAADARRLTGRADNVAVLPVASR
jgi:hypothetical protein